MGGNRNSMNLIALMGMVGGLSGSSFLYTGPNPNIPTDRDKIIKEAALIKFKASNLRANDRKELISTYKRLVKDDYRCADMADKELMEYWFDGRPLPGPDATKWVLSDRYEYLKSCMYDIIDVYNRHISNMEFTINGGEPVLLNEKYRVPIVNIVIVRKVS